MACKFFSMPLLMFAPPSGCPIPYTEGKHPEGSSGAFPRVTLQVCCRIGPLNGTSSAIHAILRLRYLGLFTVIGEDLHWDLVNLAK